MQNSGFGMPIVDFAHFVWHSEDVDLISNVCHHDIVLSCAVLPLYSVEVQLGIDNLMLMRSFRHPMYQIDRTRSGDELVEAIFDHLHSQAKVFDGDDKHCLFQVSLNLLIFSRKICIIFLMVAV